MADGSQANIPEPGARAKSATVHDGGSAGWKWRSRKREPRPTGRGEPRRPAPEKSRVSVMMRAGPYRRPTQVDGSSRPRCAGETTLRNSAKQPRNFGRRGPPRGGAENRPMQLFNKNTALRERASGNMECDT